MTPRVPEGRQVVPIPDHAVVDPGWLTLREQADARARALAEPVLLPPLLAALAAGPTAGPTAGQPRHVLDLGAGTGANLRRLAPLLGDPADQYWTLLDHDPRLAPHGPAPWRVLHADLLTLPELLPRLTPQLPLTPPALVTAAALLDLLDPPRIDALVRAVVAAGVPALFTLTVTGHVQLGPEDPLDGALAEAFDDHQRRGGKPGPAAGAEVAERFRRAGWTVLTAATPWVLRAADEPELMAAWALGRVEAAVEQRPELAGPAQRWLDARGRQIGRGGLRAEIGHVDLLALPGHCLPSRSLETGTNR